MSFNYPTVPDLKDPAVVCQEPCNHRECRDIRRTWAGAICPCCHNELIVGQTFLWNKDGKPVHGWCKRLQDAREKDGED